MSRRNAPSEAKPFLAANDKWIAPGHNSIVPDPAGEDWILYHAVDVRRPRTGETDEVNTRRVMLIDRIVWIDGWPQVEGGAPSSGARPGPSPAPQD